MDHHPLIVECLPDFQRAGETLLACGCNNSHSGNLSVRVEDRVVITRTGTMLGSLSADDLVMTSMSPTTSARQRASTELPVHLRIYERTSFTAIAHGHAIWATLAGWFAYEITPIDVDGAYYFGRIPVVECAPATATPQVGDALADVFNGATPGHGTTSGDGIPVAIVRGHGVFAAGDSIESAMQRITSVNDSAHLIVEAHRLGLDVDALEQKEYLRFDHRS